MDRASAAAALAQLDDGRVDPGCSNSVTRRSGLGIGVGYGVTGLVNAVELWRPDDFGDRALFRDVDVFALPARTVVDRMCALGLTVTEHGDRPAIVSELVVALWRPFVGDDEPEDPQGFYFSSALVARPGYYDTPSEAAARQERGEPAGY